MTSVSWYTTTSFVFITSPFNIPSPPPSFIFRTIKFQMQTASANKAYDYSPCFKSPTDPIFIFVPPISFIFSKFSSLYDLLKFLVFSYFFLKGVSNSTLSLVDIWLLSTHLGNELTLMIFKICPRINKMFSHLVRSTLFDKICDQYVFQISKFCRPESQPS